MTKRLFFVVVAVVLTLAGWYYRDQNIKAAKSQASQIVRSDVLAQDTAPAIASLKAYVRGHMGAAADFTLTAGYIRAEARAKAAAVASAANSQIYAAAQAACAGKTNSIIQAQCNGDYLSKHLANVPAPTPVVAPKLADYQYRFRSPWWTPDTAGALVAGAIGALALGLYVNRRKRG